MNMFDADQSASADPHRYTVLLVEDTPALVRTYAGFLRDEPYDLTYVDSGEAALARVADRQPDVIVLDLKLPDMEGVEVLNTLSTMRAGCPVVAITAYGSVETAVSAMRAGADDFLLKPFSAERFRVTLKNLVEKRRLAQLVKTYEATTSQTHFEGLIGSSLAMQAVYRCIESAATSTAPVFITGESGTGKELVAEAIHARSQRRGRAFLPLNCAAIPKDLIESELFGHVKGAFSGAISDRKGAASLADQGTLFLDEICEMDPYAQTKLLRFIQSGCITKVGSGRPEVVDVRFVSATNRDPFTEVRNQRFREDLYYRLHVIPIHLPALRERGDDIMLIAHRLLEDFSMAEGKNFQGFDSETEALLSAYPWPGNVRELQNVIRQMVVMNDGEVISAGMLPRPVMDPHWAETRPHPPHSTAVPASFSEAPAPSPERPPLAQNAPQSETPDDISSLAAKIRPLAEIERQAIEEALALCDNDVRKAAVFLGIGPATIYRKLKSWRDMDGNLSQS